MRIFTSLEGAEAARAELDAAAGLPRVHAEGEYTLAEPGLAADRLRARGIRTDHAVDIVPNDEGTEYAVPSTTPGTIDPGTVELDVDAWRGTGRDRRDRRT